MVYVELEPELSACVETKAKRRYEQIQSELLGRGEKGEVRERLEILRLFLETTDFSKLRNKYEKHLVEGRRVKFVLYLVEGKTKYEMRIIQDTGKVDK